MTAIGSSAAPTREWTVLYYMDGKNNLASMARHSFNSLDKVGSDDRVSLVAEIGLPQKPVLRGLIEKGKSTAEFQDVGEKDMGNAGSVREFVEWGMQKYPAKHYALVLWDHGAGFKGSLTDDESKSLVTNKALAQALDAVHLDTGHKIDVLNFNACLMNQAEVAYELRNAAGLMVGSEETEAGFRLPIPGLYGTTPQHLVAADIKEAVQAKGGLSPEELAKLFVWESKNQFISSMFTPTQAAIDLSKMEAVAAHADALAGSLLEALDRDPSLVDALRDDVRHTQHYLAADMYVEPYAHYRDLGDFTRVLARDERFSKDPAIHSSLEGLQKAIQDAVVAEWHATESASSGRSLEGSTGLSTYLPPDYGYDQEGKSSIDGIPNGGTHGYETTSYARNTRWEKLLKTIAKDDDLLGRFPDLNRALMTAGPVAGTYGKQFAAQAAGGADRVSGIALWPLPSFPYLAPVPAQAAAAVGAVGGALNVQKGLSKVQESIERTDSPKENRFELAVNGAINAAIGAGTIFTCGALLAGVGSVAAPVAMGVMAMSGERTLARATKELARAIQTRGLSVQDKIDQMSDARPQFGSVREAAA